MKKTTVVRLECPHCGSQLQLEPDDTGEIIVSVVKTGETAVPPEDKAKGENDENQNVEKNNKKSVWNILFGD